MPLGRFFRLTDDAIAKLPFEILSDISLAQCPTWVKQQADWGSTLTTEYATPLR